MKRAVLIGLVVAVPLVADAQTSQSAPIAGERPDPARLRYQLQVMERVLEQAVQHGARVMGARMQEVAPSMLLFAGPARARGFWLEGYGVFFDVEVPALRQSVTWSFRMLNQGDLGLESAIALLRRQLQSLGDGDARNDLERALKRLESQLGSMLRERVEPARAAVASQGGPARAPQPPPPSPPAEDPVDVYTAEVKGVLAEALLDYGGGITLGPDEWLTVAARDAEGALAPGELSRPATIMLRVRGRDLSAFRGGRLTRDEARKRVEEVREF